jgi:hypothetical protein
MANIFTTNPWILDGSSLNTILVPTQVMVEHFEYVNYSNGTSSKVVLADRFGHIVWQTTGDTDGVQQRSGKVKWIHGLQELTHTDGLVLVYLE